MRLLLLSDPNSVHTIKWATSLAKNKIEIIILGLGSLSVSVYDNIENINIVTLNETVGRREGTFKKLIYLKALPLVKATIKSFQPAIVHAHYATSYGLLGALSGFSPFILSVWGSDVFSFPKKSFLHRLLFQFNLNKAAKILSTSHVMAKETQLYTTKEIEITPFGIDTQQFKPIEVESIFEEDAIVIGTIKALEEVYGIEYLIRAFGILKTKHPHLPLKLLLVGKGSLRKQLTQLTEELNLAADVVFTGSIPFQDVPKYHNMLSVAVFLSNSESFGVAVVEVAACEKPVVVANIGGLPEVIQNNISGFIVPPKNPQKAAEAIEKLVLDPNLRTEMGKAGRKNVQEKFNWNDNVQQMLTIYEKIR